MGWGPTVGVVRVVCVWGGWGWVGWGTSEAGLAGLVSRKTLPVAAHSVGMTMLFALLPFQLTRFSVGFTHTMPSTDVAKQVFTSATCSPRQR
eukprot:COSAG06_NODE_2354_length_7021_cov_10.485264_6_plen_92_part_00